MTKATDRVRYDHLAVLVRGSVSRGSWDGWTNVVAGAQAQLGLMLFV